MITNEDKAELDAHYKACEEAAFQSSVEYQATQPLRDEIATLKAELAQVRSDALAHLDEKHLAQNERNALKAKIERAKEYLADANWGASHNYLYGCIDKALKELTQ